MRIPVLKEIGSTAGKLAINAGRVLQDERFLRFGVPLIFFVCFFVFLLWYIDPSVIHSSNGMNIHNYVALMHAKDASSYTDLLYRHLFILELTPEYLRGIAGTPGGWAQLAVTLCIYACRSPVAGALTVTGLALFFYWIFGLYIMGIGARRPFVLRFVPAFFVLTVCAWYELSYCAFLVPIGGALAFVVFYQRLRLVPVLTKVLWLLGLFWVAWYFMQWGCLLMLLFVVIHEFFCSERRIAVAVAIAAAVNGALLYGADAWFIPLGMTINWSDFTILSGLPLVVIVFFPLAAITFAVLSRFRHVPGGSVKTIGAIVRGVVLVCATGGVAGWLYRDPVNRDTRTVARTVHHVMNGEWEEILHEKTAAMFADFPQKAGALQVFMVHTVDHALCRTGRMGDKLFTFPQALFTSYDPLLFLQSMFLHSYVNWFVVLDLAMDLGMVNTAEKIAGELMENMGPYPEIIYRRALIQIAIGNRDAASVYLGKLACMPFYGAEAKRLLGMLDNNGAILSEPRIETMCTNRDTVDYFLDNNLSGDFLLRHLLQSNPVNKAAYDYLMTFYLLYNRLDQVAAIAPSAAEFGYAVLPRNWEEALCLYQSEKMVESSSGMSFSGVRQETVDRFIGFTRTWIPMQHDSAAAAKLAPAFGDSYFYFSVFRFSAGALP